ncbi:uncharacterized protein SETTUDRAFT_171415 [Exserohilum turcica Et28A]|uniref:Uncharacterized protein n=1 Tax=Exserohilum turcicum (strain 28A) TaxID=671987 RepID=R0KCW2_EXST2|nr:uncharacterized protein SETTUDRAFT_171415 [Exserohilum turcica Et28A]EOA87199.1 hypothetical protein SETTUDRAFT_171415 [Exserohilum turcica Et28A]
MASIRVRILVLASTCQHPPLTECCSFEPRPKPCLCPCWTAADHSGGTKPGFLLGASAASHQPAPGISGHRTALPVWARSPWGCGQGGLRRKGLCLASTVVQAGRQAGAGVVVVMGRGGAATGEQCAGVHDYLSRPKCPCRSRGTDYSRRKGGRWGSRWSTI